MDTIRTSNELGLELIAIQLLVSESRPHYEPLVRFEDEDDEEDEG